MVKKVCVGLSSFALAVFLTLRGAFAEGATPGTMGAAMIADIQGWVTDNILAIGVVCAIVMGIGFIVVTLKRSVGRSA